MYRHSHQVTTKREDKVLGPFSRLSPSFRSPTSWSASTGVQTKLRSSFSKGLEPVRGAVTERVLTYSPAFWYSPLQAHISKHTAPSRVCTKPGAPIRHGLTLTACSLKLRYTRLPSMATLGQEQLRLAYLVVNWQLWVKCLAPRHHFGVSFHPCLAGTHTCNKRGMGGTHGPSLGLLLAPNCPSEAERSWCRFEPLPPCLGSLRRGQG